MIRRRPRALLAVASLLAVVGVGAWVVPAHLVARADPAIPPEVDILSANIEEVPPVDPTDVPHRQILLTVEVAGQPSCGSATRFLRYGFLIDSDRDATTGASSPAFAGVGIEARIDARCDPGTGTFVSSVGAVTTETSPAGSFLVHVHTTAAQLPSVDFTWIAYAENDTLFTRLPHEPDVGSFTTLERALP